MQVILGGGGAIGNELAKELKNYTNQIRIVSRNPISVNSTPINQAIKEIVVAG